MAKDTPYVDVQNLSKSFGALQLFDNISFSIAEGQRVGLVAKNGTGKSTLLAVLAGKVEMVGGFVENQQIGFGEQHVGECDTFLLSATQLPHGLVEVANLQLRQHLFGFQHLIGIALVVEAGIEHTLVRVEPWRLFQESNPQVAMIVSINN